MEKRLSQLSACGDNPGFNPIKGRRLIVNRYIRARVLLSEIANRGEAGGCLLQT